jgi:hypothetical protein
MLAAMVVAGRRRRRRRPRWLILVILFVFTILAVRAVASSGSSGTSRRLAEQAYVDEMRPHVERSTQQGAELADVREHAAELGRTGVDRRLNRLRRDAASVYRAVVDAEPPASLAPVHTLLVSTMYIRAEALEALATSLPAALGSEPDEPVVNGLSRAGDELATADSTYRVFLRAVPRARGPNTATLPASRWVGAAGQWSEAEVRALVATLRASTTAAPIHDVAVILVTTEPTAVGRSGDASVLPPAKTLRLQIVVANVGNEPERDVAVVAAVTDLAGGVDTARDFVDLAPGQRMTVELGGLVPIPNQALSLGVRAGPVAGEGNLDDNEQVRLILVRGD